MAIKVEVQHSKNFEKVKGYYDDGFWGENRVQSAVGKWITAEEAAEILSADTEANG